MSDYKRSLHLEDSRQYVVGSVELSQQIFIPQILPYLLSVWNYLRNISVGFLTDFVWMITRRKWEQGKSITIYLNEILRAILSAILSLKLGARSERFRGLL